VRNISRRIVRHTLRLLLLRTVATSRQLQPRHHHFLLLLPLDLLLPRRRCLHLNLLRFEIQDRHLDSSDLFALNLLHLLLSRYLNDPINLPDILLNILSHLKLKLELPDKKFQNSILLNFSTDFDCPVDRYAGDDPHKINHVDRVDRWMVADVR
jgi:hypothetical protein